MRHDAERIWAGAWLPGELCVRLDKHHSDYLHLLEMLEEWYAAWKQDHDDSSSLDEYTDWKLNYPHPMKRNRNK